MQGWSQLVVHSAWPDHVGLDAISSLPGMTSVGGTTLSTDEDGQWLAEQAWVDSPLSQGHQWRCVQALSEAGVAGQVVHRAGQEAPRRLTPDVSATADPFTGIRIRFDQQDLVGAGTSQAAPVWAGLTALMNQYLLANGGHRWVTSTHCCTGWPRARTPRVSRRDARRAARSTSPFPATTLPRLGSPNVDCSPATCSTSRRASRLDDDDDVSHLRVTSRRGVLRKLWRDGIASTWRRTAWLRAVGVCGGTGRARAAPAVAARLPYLPRHSRAAFGVGSSRGRVLLLHRPTTVAGGTHRGRRHRTAALSVAYLKGADTVRSSSIITLVVSGLLGVAAWGGLEHRDRRRAHADDDALGLPVSTPDSCSPASPFRWAFLILLFAPMVVMRALAPGSPRVVDGHDDWGPWRDLLRHAGSMTRLAPELANGPVDPDGQSPVHLVVAAPSRVSRCR